MKQKSLGIDPKKEFANALCRSLVTELKRGTICSDVVEMLQETGESDLVFQFKLLKNGKIRWRILIWDDNLKAS